MRSFTRLDPSLKRPHALLGIHLNLSRLRPTVPLAE